MKRLISLLVIVIVIAITFNSSELMAESGLNVVNFPTPDTLGRVSLEQAIQNRRNVRDFTEQNLTSNLVGQMLWAGQGIIDKDSGYRATPSAGNINPMQIYVVLPEGVYLYNPETHSMKKTINRDVRNTLFTAAYRQDVVKNAPCTFVIVAQPRLTETKYRRKGKIFTTLEAGHIAQNMNLQAVTIGLGSVSVGAFDNKSVRRICKLKETQTAIYMVCVGYPKQPTKLQNLQNPATISQTVKEKAENKTPKVLFIVAEKRFRDSELFDLQDILEVAQVETYIASSKVGKVVGEDRDTVISDILINNIDIDEYDALIFISGSGSNLYEDDRNIINLVRRAYKKGKILAGINTTPTIFANANIIKGRNVAVFPSERKNINRAGGKWNSELEVVVDGNIITAKESKDARRLGRAILHAIRIGKTKKTEKLNRD